VLVQTSPAGEKRKEIINSFQIMSYLHWTVWKNRKGPVPDAPAKTGFFLQNPRWFMGKGKAFGF